VRASGLPWAVLHRVLPLVGVRPLAIRAASADTAKSSATGAAATTTTTANTATTTTANTTPTSAAAAATNTEPQLPRVELTAGCTSPLGNDAVLFCADRALALARRCFMAGPLDEPPEALKLSADLQS
jgi:hypothetical protein